MVEPAAAVGRGPVLRAVAPPGVEPLGRGDEFAAEIDPVVRGLQPRQRLNLYRRMADHVEQLLVAPHVAFERGDVEIAGEDDGQVAQAFGPARHALQKIELLAEFGVRLAVGNVAARGDIDVFEAEAVFEADADVAGFAIGLPVEPVILGKGNAAEDGDAVVHFLTMDGDVFIAERAKRRVREIAVDDLRFLKAQDVGGGFAEELLDDVHAEPHRIDVPRRNADLLAHRPAM